MKEYQYLMLPSRDGPDIIGSVSGIWQNPAIFQLSGIKPDTAYTRYPVSEYSARYPANWILIKHFFLIKDLRFENFSIIHHMSKKAGIRPDIQYPAFTGYPVSGF